MNYEELLEKCESHLRAGRADQVGRELTGLNTAQIERSLRLPFAKICRRANLISLGLRILAPLVRPQDRSGKIQASADESAEYAFLMMKNGSLVESKKILSTISAPQAAEAVLYNGFCHMMRWEYAEAIPFLEKYLATSPGEYQDAIARVNLAAAMVADGRFDAANEKIGRLLETLQSKGYSRLAANALEIRSQIHLHCEQFDLCAKDLDQAQAVLDAEQTSDQLLILKWRSFLAAMGGRTAEPIEKFRLEALKRRHWESVRECDFYTLKLDFNPLLFDKLYFGTPYAAYRSRLEKEFKTQASHAYYFHGSQSGPILDLDTGSLVTSDERESIAGSKIHQIITILFRDLYRPTQVGALFAELYPDEYFDPFSSPNRVHQNLWRAREWLDGRLPVKIEKTDNQYRAIMTGDMGLIMTRTQKLADRHSVLFETLRSRFGERGRFKGHEAMKALGLTHTSFRRLATWAMNSGLLERNGRSSAVWYKISA